MTYDRMSLGRRFTPVEFRVDSGTRASYGAIVGTAPSAVPVGLLALYARRAYLTEGVMPSGGVMAGLEITNLGAMPLDTLIAATAEVTDRKERKGKGWVTIDISFTAGDCGEFARVRVIGVWPL